VGPGQCWENSILLHSPPALSECQGKLQELHRLLQSLESLHRIPSAPVIPTHQVRARKEAGATQSLPSLSPPGQDLLPLHIAVVSWLSASSHATPLPEFHTGYAWVIYAVLSGFSLAWLAATPSPPCQ
jgi:hypothetical protein